MRVGSAQNRTSNPQRLLMDSSSWEESTDSSSESTTPLDEPLEADESYTEEDLDETEEFDKHFCCPICYDLLESPTTRKCGHTFCAACLRASKQNRHCAVCRTKDSCPASQLRENIALREAIEATYPGVARKREARRQREYRLQRLRQGYVRSERYRLLAHFLRTLMSERRIIKLHELSQLVPSDKL